MDAKHGQLGKLKTDEHKIIYNVKFVETYNKEARLPGHCLRHPALMIMAMESRTVVSPPEGDC